MSHEQCKRHWIKKKKKPELKIQFTSFSHIFPATKQGKNKTNSKTQIEMQRESQSQS